MATRLKTIEYWFPELSSLPDNTDTNFTQITAYIPEFSGTVTFKSVTLDVILQDAAITANNINRRQISMSVGGAGYTAINNTNTLTQSGEQKWIQMTGDFTSHFTSNWTSGSSKTIDSRILVDSAAGAPILSAVTAKLVITFTYDDTQATHIKTVRFPLATPLTSQATSKPGTATDTIPAFDTWLPEASKTIRQISLVVQGNEEQAGTTDLTLSWEIDSLGVFTSPSHEEALNSSSWFRHNEIQTFTTNTTHSFYIWASIANKFAHPQAMLVITYEYSPSSSTSIMNSLILPMEWDSPIGGNTSSDYQRSSRQLWIEEPTTITIKESGLYLFWEQKAPIAGLNARVGTGSFRALTSLATTVCGGMGAMLRAETIIGSLSRGLNTLQADMYRTDTLDLGFNVSSFWIINYSSGKATDGVGAHNHSVCWNLFAHDTTNADNNRTTSAWSPNLPETYWFMNSIGVNYQYLTNTTGQAMGVTVQVERLSAEGGNKWEIIYSDIGDTDAEVGIRNVWSTSRSVYYRWPNDADTQRITVQTSRRYKAYITRNTNSWDHLDFWFTYHSITYSVSGTVSGSDGGTINIDLFRTGTDDKVLSTSRSGNGAYSFTWYDNTVDLYTVAYEDSTHTGRSDDSQAT
jgi:hypothetical protein